MSRLAAPLCAVLFTAAPALAQPTPAAFVEVPAANAAQRPVAGPPSMGDPSPEVPGRPFPVQSPWARIDFRADLQNLFYLKNDSDFDRTRPAYDQNGQSVGAFATILRPRATLHILDTLRITYELEVGLNYWSKNNPDEQDALSPSVFTMKHREVFGEAEFKDGRYGIKLGYTRYRDPTGLFVDHWIGMGQAWTSWAPGKRLGVFLGQVPDQVYEGLTVEQNNFKRDIWLGGARTDLILSDKWRLSAALTGLVDTHLVDQARWLLSPSLHLERNGHRWSGFVDAVLQAGQDRYQATASEDALRLAWAAQAQLRYQIPWLELRWTALALSPDDQYDGNRHNGVFLYSGKSRSATVMMTEDEVRDSYNNFDERASRHGGGFFSNRAGLFVGDMIATAKVSELFRPSLIVGAATVLNPKNAAGGALVGVETDLMMELVFNDWLIGHVVFGGFFPGSAGAALINTVNNTATDPVTLAEASLLFRY